MNPHYYLLFQCCIYSLTQGRTNQFHILTRDKKAILYNDRSVLEMHHAAASFFQLQRPENNFLAAMPQKEYTLLMFFDRDVKIHSKYPFLVSNIIFCFVCAIDFRYNELRKVIIEMVLVTDLTHHFDFLAQFKAMTASGMRHRPITEHIYY